MKIAQTGLSFPKRCWGKRRWLGATFLEELGFFESYLKSPHGDFLARDGARLISFAGS